MRTHRTRVWSILSCWVVVAAGMTAVAATAPGAVAAGGYDPGVPNMAEPHYEGTSTLLADGRVLVAGGEWNLEGYPPVTGGGEIYTGSEEGGYWENTGDMVVRRSNHTATLLADGRVLVTGGYQPGVGIEASTEIWDPATNAWSAAAPLSTPRWGHQAVLLNTGKVLVLGGTPELYDPATDSWAAAAAPPASPPNKGHAVPLDNGQVLWPRYSATGPVRSLLYTPSTDSWSLTGASIHAAFYPTKLNDGRVLALSGGRFRSSEIYDPASRTWTATSSMSYECGTSSATLSTGRVLVLCPSSGHDSGQSFAQMYDPQTDTWTDTAVEVRWNGEMITPLANGKALVTGGTNYEEHVSDAVVFVDGVPGVPAQVSAGAGNRSALVTWLAPSDLGASPITGYTIRGFTASGEHVTQQVAAHVRSVTFTSLTNGTAYSFQVSARNAIGVGQDGHAQPVVPRSVTCTISGTAGANTLTGTPQDDVICGLGGNDIIRGQGGNDTIIGGAGIDSVEYADAIAPITANLVSGLATGQGSDTLREIENVNGSPYADRLTGNGGPNRLAGKDGNDILAGLGGPDAMYGGGGDDRLRFDSDLDAGYGGLGTDAASFADANDDVRVDLTTGRSIVGGYYRVERGTLTAIENIIGGPGSDHIVGSSGPNVLRGAAGYDDIQGADGDDKLYGDTDGDRLSGGLGTDLCAGGDGGSDTADSTCETILGVP